MLINKKLLATNREILQKLQKGDISVGDLLTNGGLLNPE